MCENLTYFYFFLLSFYLYVSMYIRFVAKRLTGKLTAASSGVLIAVQLHFKKGLNIIFGLCSESAYLIFQELPFLDFQIGGGNVFFTELSTSFSVKMMLWLLYTTNADGI